MIGQCTPSRAMPGSIVLSWQSGPDEPMEVVCWRVEIAEYVASSILPDIVGTFYVPYGQPVRPQPIQAWEE